jgi:23S rRNA-/tRNA-specific pseudouridylate synthase
MYLGDGHILDTGRTYQLRVTLDALYPGIIEDCRTYMQLSLPDVRANAR